MKPERLDKILSGTGLYSRSGARGVIAAGLVTVDGAVVRKPDTKVRRDAEIMVSGERIDGAEHVYILLNKPTGYVSASQPEGKYPPVTSLLPEYLQKRGLGCVGRLDADVTGLLLLTDDGDFVHRVTAPRAAVEKTYEARLDGPLGPEDVTALAAGIVLRGGVEYRSAKLVIDEEDPAFCRITVTEGKYHEVKNLMAARGRRVLALRRVSIGGLVLDETLAEGAFRPLSPEEASRCFI